MECFRTNCPQLLCYRQDPGRSAYRQDMEYSAGCKAPGAHQQKPEAPRTLLDVLQNEMNGQVKGGIYHKIQIDLTYNSNHIEAAA